LTWFWSSFNVWNCLGKLWKPNLGWRGSKLGFWDGKCEIRDSQLSWLATASKLAREASNMVTESHVCPPRRAKLLATASNVSQGAWLARHGEQSYSPRRALWWQETCLARHGEQTTWEASCLSSGFSILHFGFFSHVFALN